ncbi:MAG: hypothetical protein IJN79_02105 [Clostridia bacterium]|nr:hypothetical protein [Clostridia bacterium]MBQ7051579.1 hypothetical protein [Clostridia bacterium]
MGFLDALYRGEIDLQEQFKPRKKETIAARKKYLRLREQVLLELDEAAQARVVMLLEEYNAVSAMEMEEAYIEGMRTGAKMINALLGDEKEAH